MSHGIIRSSSRWWGGSDVRSVSPAGRDCGRGCPRRRRYRSFSRRRCPMGIVRDSNLQSPEPATDLIPSWRKHARLTGLFSPGCIIRCKREGARSAAGAHHAGPSPLARSSLPRRPVTSTTTSFEAVVVAAPPFILPLLFLPPVTPPPFFGRAAAPAPPPPPPVQSEVAVQGQERDAHRDVPTLEVVAAAMKKRRRRRRARGGDDPPPIATTRDNAGRIRSSASQCLPDAYVQREEGKKLTYDTSQKL
jgi:hypothetical protein